MIKGKSETSKNNQQRSFAKKVVKTKICPPADRPGIIERSRLSKVNMSLPDQRLTLVVAPAGFGKTTLLQQLRHQFISEGGAVAWLSLENTENDLKSATSYLVSSCGVLDKQVSETVAPFFITTTNLSGDEVLADLINVLSSLSGRVLIVIDDYEKIHTQETHDFFFKFIQHLPENAHCIVGSREMPPWPLAKGKLRGEVKVLSADKLRFTTAETQLFLEEICRFELPTDEIEALNGKTEGWVAALQLVGLALKARKPKAQLLDLLSGRRHILFDYLADTVFVEQDEETQEFLVRTACLDRLSPELCDAVTGKRNGRNMLRKLEESSLFLGAVDDNREWFRYHPLFAEFLCDRMDDSRENYRQRASQRASLWFEQQKLLVEAVEYAIAAQDFDHAATLMETVAYEAICSSQMDILSSWINRLPENFLKAHPSASIFCIWASFLTGQKEDVDKRLPSVHLIIEKLLADPDPSRQHEGRRWRDFLSLLSKIWSSPQTDKQYEIEALQGLRAKQSPDNALLLGLIDVTLAKWFLQKGNLGNAFSYYLSAQAYSSQVENYHAAVQAACGTAFVRHLQGRLDEAIEICKNSLGLATTQSGELLPVAAASCLRLAEIYYERNNIKSSKYYLNKAVTLSKRLNDPSISRKLEILTTRIIYVEQGPACALKYLCEAEQWMRKRSDMSYLRRLYALHIWLHCEVGDLESAGALLQILALPIDSLAPNPLHKIPFWDEDTYLSFSRFLIADGQFKTAIKWLKRLLRDAEFDERRLSAVKISGLLALSYNLDDRTAESMRAIREMLVIGEKYGCVRSILDLGFPIMGMLSDYRNHCSVQMEKDDVNFNLGYVDQLISGDGNNDNVLSDPFIDQNPTKVIDNVPDQLTKREKEILILIAEGMKNRAIAEQLFIAETTLKWHVQNLYSKLYVNSRTQAVLKARKLGLIS